MEYVCNNQANIATKIYELGLKAFPDEVAIAKQFLEFQLQIHDEASKPPELLQPALQAEATLQTLGRYSRDSC